MEPEESNPYATPRSDVTQLDVEGGWQVRGGVLFFQDGAKLPKVDLYSGRDDLPLTAASMEFAVSRGSIGGLVMLVLRIAPMAFLVVAVMNDHWELVPWAVGLLFVGMLLRFLPKGAVLKARLRWHVSTESEKRRRRWNTVMSLLLYGALLGMILGLVFAPPQWRYLGILAVLGLSVYVRLQGRKYPRLWCAKVVDGWFEVNGIPAAGLAALEGRRFEDGPVADEAVDKKRKVYTARLHRMSVLTLLGKNWWNPASVVMILLMKVFRSKRLERDMLHWSEARELKGSEWDADLRNKWDELQGMGDFAGWRLLKAQQLDSIQGDQTTQWFTVVSPDNRHALTEAVVRFVNAMNSAEVFETTLRSWLPSGVIVLSSNLRLERLRSPDFRVQRFRGGPEVIAARHAASLGGEEAVPADFPDGWRVRMEEEQRKRHTLMEETGVYGPVREESSA